MRAAQAAGAGVVEGGRGSLAAEALVCAALRGASFDEPAVAACDADAIFEAAVANGLHVLLHERMAVDAGETWPDALRDRIAQAARGEAITEMLRAEELTRVLEVLGRAGVPALLMKGAALAYTLYASPPLRPRVDTDLLVPPEAAEEAAEVLVARGYRRGHRISGRYVEYQCPYVRFGRAGARHVIDLHWRVSNRQALARAFEFDELAAGARPVAELGAHARAVGALDALLLGAVHLLGHHRAQRRPLVWLYDLDRLLRRLEARDAARLAERIAAKRVRGLCRDAFAQVRAWFGTPLGPTLERSLADAAGTREPTAALLAPGRVSLFVADLRALPGLGARLQLLREATLPPRRYLEERYGPIPSVFLPWLHMRRWSAAARRAVCGPRPPEL